jgi:hypothetical protein
MSVAESCGSFLEDCVKSRQARSIHLESEPVLNAFCRHWSGSHGCAPLLSFKIAFSPGPASAYRRDHWDRLVITRGALSGSYRSLAPGFPRGTEGCCERLDVNARLPSFGRGYALGVDTQLRSRREPEGAGTFFFERSSEGAQECEGCLGTRFFARANCMFGELVNLLIVPPRQSPIAAGTGAPVSQLEPTGQLKLSAPNFVTGRFPDGGRKAAYDPSSTQNIRCKRQSLQGAVAKTGTFVAAQ